MLHVPKRYELETWLHFDYKTGEKYNTQQKKKKWNYNLIRSCNFISLIFL